MVDANAAHRLAARLRDLHLHAGEPSMRTVAGRTGGVVSHSTVHQALSGKRTPRWGALELIVEALGGDSDDFHPLWKAARSQARETMEGRTVATAGEDSKRFRMEDALGYYVSAEDAARYEMSLRLLKDRGANAAAAYLAEEIGERWASMLMDPYLSILEDLQEYEKISQVVEKCRGLDMQSAPAAHRVARFFDEHYEDFTESARHERNALRRDPNNAEYAWFLASYLEAIKENREAHNYYELASRMKPNDADFLHSYLSSLLKRSEFALAESVATTSPISSERHVKSLTANAMALQGKLAESETLLRSITDRNDRDNRDLAKILSAQEKTGEALEILRTCWADGSGNVGSGLLYANMLREAGSDGEADRVVDQVIARTRKTTS
ncbi:hypothetical protein [Streptomyces sp. NPDC058678]|uniref:hypothetical protein n=1 Tax=Streptomyces sp. NPDC058678 TaxID=3346595 RepID=UPI00365BD01A